MGSRYVSWTTTGFAMNQARDLGPPLAFQLLPIKKSQ